MNACVGAFAAASDGVGMFPAPIEGMTGAAAGEIGASGPFTQQHAGRSSSDNRTVEIVVRMAIGFHGSTRRTRMSRSRKVPGFIRRLRRWNADKKTPAPASRIIPTHGLRHRGHRPHEKLRFLCRGEGLLL